MYSLVNKKQFYRKMYYYSLYEESRAYCTEFKASLRYIVTRKREAEVGVGGGSTKTTAKGCPTPCCSTFVLYWEERSFVNKFRQILAL